MSGAGATSNVPLTSTATRDKEFPQECWKRQARTAWGLGAGLRGMSERMRQLGGRLELVSTEAGTTVRALASAAEVSARMSETA